MGRSGGQALIVDDPPVSGRTLDRLAKAYARLGEADRAVCPGTLAQVKIHCKWRSCAWWVWHKISSAFDLGLI